MQYSLVIFLCILAAGAAVLLGFATIRFWQSRDDDREEAVLPVSEVLQSQAIYMRDVRTRNQHDIARMTGHGYGFRSEDSMPPPSRAGMDRGYYGRGGGGQAQDGGAYYYQGSAVSGPVDSSPALSKAWH